MKEPPLDIQAEFAEECEHVIRALSGMCFSFDQNGHFFPLASDMAVLAAAVDLLKRARSK